MKRKFMIMLVLVSGLLAYTYTRQSEMIIIYSSMEQFRNDLLQEKLIEKFPDVETKVVYMPTGKAAAKLDLEGSHTDASIVVGLEVAYMNKIADNFKDIEGISKIDYIDEFKPEHFNNKFVIWERQGGSFIVNETILKEKGLKIPTTYEELLDPNYKGLIAMPDPKSSGTGYYFVKNRLDIMGDEAGFEYFEALEKNIKQFTESGSGPIKLLNQGEIAIGLGMTVQGVNEINNGRDYKLIFPEEGSPYSYTGTGLIKNTNRVLPIFEYIVNEFILLDKEFFSPEEIYKGQENTIDSFPKDIKYTAMNGIADIVEKERILKAWKY